PPPPPPHFSPPPPPHPRGPLVSGARRCVKDPGVVLGGAIARRVIVLDGFISGAAALIAHRLCPTVADYLVASHLSAETGHRIALSHLGLRPLLDLGMRLGEGTGAVLAMGLVEAAAACLSEMATFDEAGVSGAESAD
ncbi:MAG: nicotinate-nucleotide--dimethylbenzimidazole phosphoribosyltransferase, partial [Dehalococcoidia bacterium]|nr:nicotinate-nucleotide--dimethylbenzimidazole phosphoribosyltransferase [Dehalococcoidia bacterium]